MTAIDLDIDSFDSSSREAMGAAWSAAKRLDNGFIGTEHLLLGAAAVDAGVRASLASYAGSALDALEAELRRAFAEHPEWPRFVSDEEALRALGIDGAAIRERAEQTFGVSYGSHPGGPGFTVFAAEAMGRAAAALAGSDTRVAARNIAAETLRNPEGLAAKSMLALGADPVALAAQIEGLPAESD